MSGFQKSTRKGTTYTFANIIGGMFHITSPKEAEGTVSRINKNGKQVFEIVTDELVDTYLHDVMEKESEYGTMLNITCKSHLDSKDEANQFFVVQCSMNSAYAFSFLNRVKNVQLDEPLTLKVFEIENKGEDEKTYKTRTLGIYQNDKICEKSWTKENSPVPLAILIVDKKGNPVLKSGKQQWDDTEKTAFLIDYVNTTIRPELIEFSGAVVNSDIAKTIDEVDAEAGVDYSQA